jgi:hypothetical protein
MAAWGGIRRRNLNTGGDDLRLFPFAGRSSSVVPAVRAVRHPGEVMTWHFPACSRGLTSASDPLSRSANWGVYAYQLSLASHRSCCVHGRRARSACGRSVLTRLPMKQIWLRCGHDVSAWLWPAGHCAGRGRDNAGVVGRVSPLAAHRATGAGHTIIEGGTGGSGPVPVTTLVGFRVSPSGGDFECLVPGLLT